MAPKKGLKKTTRRRNRKNVDRGQAHIQSTFNNTIVTVDNKLIINGVNAITKIIEAINKIPKALKVSVGIYLGILMINKLRENHEIKMKAYRQMAMTDAEKERASQQKTLGSILEEKKLLEKKAEALEENLKLQQALEKEGFEVIIANDGQQAVELFKEKYEELLEYKYMYEDLCS